MFNNKIILITGGTGSFGSAFVDYLIKKKINFKEIRIFSRDEKKQDDFRKKLKTAKVKFFLGDVRDPDSIDLPINNVDFIFHAAAYKQVPSCEFYPMEAVKTNILGTDNIIKKAIDNKNDSIFSKLGFTISSSSLPITPLSPLCGFSPNTAIFGLFILKSAIKL